MSFYEAQFAFLDNRRVIAKDRSHSKLEGRFYCFGANKDGSGILTVRFTYRNQRIRIFGAGYWRRGKKIYEQTNSI
ncbi:MAG: BrnT family toxin [Proteobacteria bacterium]|nr:BrnT family toxin [Pseudomonadota bacterium]